MDKSKKSSKINKKFEDLKNLLCLSTITPRTRRPSADNSKSWGFTSRATRAKARLITIRMATITLIQASSSLKVPLQ
jgi:hypothetical protein